MIRSTCSGNPDSPEAFELADLADGVARWWCCLRRVLYRVVKTSSGYVRSVRTGIWTQA